MLDAGEDFILLDIRLPIDAARYWINTPRRMSVSLNDLTMRYKEIPKDKRLVILDKNGKRAGLASRYLAAKGFAEIAMAGGGMNQWIKSGLPTVLGQ